MPYNWTMRSNVEEIKEKLDLAQFIGGYVKVQKAGVNFKARCPFHNEKTPSFTISPSKGVWHCFGCGRGGDIFQFVMELEHVDFAEALKMLAERAGITLTRERPEEQSKRKRLLALLDDATTFYEAALKNDKDVQEYLKSRGLKGETAKRFRVGFAPEGWRNLSEHLERKGYASDEMDATGLLVTQQHDGKVRSYDRFRGRIMFPLIDASNRVIGFTGRVFERPSAPKDEHVGGKYVNSPETQFFQKSRFLYNYNGARDAMRKEGSVIVVEGQMDVLLSVQAGVENVLAVSGTALTADHLRLMKRFAERVSFAFDMDSAGIAAARKAVELASREEMSVTLIPMPEGKDPADVASQDPDEWKRVIARAQDSMNYFLDRAVESFGLASAESKKAVARAVLPLIAAITSPVMQAHHMSTLARTIGSREDAVWKELALVMRGQGTPAADVAAPGEGDGARLVIASRQMRIERELLGFALARPELLALPQFVLPKKTDAADAIIGEIFEELGGLEETRKTNPNVLQYITATHQAVAGECLLAMEPFIDVKTDIHEEFGKLLQEWHRESIRTQIQYKEEELQRARTDADAERILSDIKKLLETSTYDG